MKQCRKKCKEIKIPSTGKLLKKVEKRLKVNFSPNQARTYSLTAAQMQEYRRSIISVALRIIREKIRKCG